MLPRMTNRRRALPLAAACFALATGLAIRPRGRAALPGAALRRGAFPRARPTSCRLTRSRGAARHGRRREDGRVPRRAVSRARAQRRRPDGTFVPAGAARRNHPDAGSAGRPRGQRTRARRAEDRRRRLDEAHVAEIALRDSELVFVGYGVEAPEAAWDDFKGVDPPARRWWC